MSSHMFSFWKEEENLHQSYSAQELGSVTHLVWRCKGALCGPRSVFVDFSKWNNNIVQQLSHCVDKDE